MIGLEAEKKEPIRSVSFFVNSCIRDQIENVDNPIGFSNVTVNIPAGLSRRHLHYNRGYLTSTLFSFN